MSEINDKQVVIVEENKNNEDNEDNNEKYQDESEVLEDIKDAVVELLEPIRNIYLTLGKFEDEQRQMSRYLSTFRVSNDSLMTINKNQNELNIKIRNLDKKYDNIIVCLNKIMHKLDIQ